MQQKRRLLGIVSFVAILIFILDGKTALSGASAGVDLCIQTVVPSLFPFFLFSSLLSGSLYGTEIPILRPIASLCSVPPGAESLLITGFLGGYPSGAQGIAQAYQSGMLSRKNAIHMLRFCSNAGPAFLFGMIRPMFPQIGLVWLLWGIHAGSALLTGWLFSENENQLSFSGSPKTFTLAQAMRSSLLAMATVCGWVILFRVMIAFLQHWFLWALPVPVQVVITGFLELSNGCCELCRIPDIPLRFLICSVMLAFGGLCVTMQTGSVAEDLPLESYMLGKCVQTAISLFFSFAAFQKKGLCCILIFVSFLILFRKIKNTSSNRAVLGV